VLFLDEAQAGGNPAFGYGPEGMVLLCHPFAHRHREN
jgi:hypothetical protein